MMLNIVDHFVSLDPNFNYRMETESDPDVEIGN